MNRIANRMFLQAALYALIAPLSIHAADSFDRLSQINKASIVMLAENGIVPKPMAARIARGIRTVMADEAKPDARRSADYLVFEEALIKAAGEDASRLHTGRSRQDIGTTSSRMEFREALLANCKASLEPREKLLDLAAKHLATVVPAYTHGVQAQPVTLAHYLLAFASALDRDAERFESFWGRLNRSPLGAAALATSRFPLDRNRLAGLLGFDGPVENSFDANAISPADTMVEFASGMGAAALTIGRFVQDLHTQYHDPLPWLTLKPSLTFSSSIMPQKRNPGPLESLRTNCTLVIGDAQTVWLLTHNATSGMSDLKDTSRVLQTATEARKMYKTFAVILGGLVVNPERSLAEVDADYSTMTEVADVLLQYASVPFRIGHHYASEITTYGRAHGKKPKDLSDEELVRIYADSTKGQKLPLPAARIREALDAEQVVRNRKGLGGTQPEEVKRMLEQHRRSLARHRAWVESRQAALAGSDRKLEEAFTSLSEVR